MSLRLVDPMVPLVEYERRRDELTETQARDAAMDARVDADPDALTLALQVSVNGALINGSVAAGVVAAHRTPGTETRMSTATLYEIGDARIILEHWLEETDGEVTPELDALLAAWDVSFTEKVERIALLIQELGDAAETVKVRQARQAARIARLRRQADDLKSYLHREMERAGKAKVTGKEVDVSIQRNPPSVKGELAQFDLADLYERWRIGDAPAFVRQIPESFALDKKAILDAYKAGQPLPDGLSIEHSSSLRIR